MKHFPVSLNLIDKRILVVGGGSVAERKVTSLLKSSNLITLVSPEITVKLQQLVEASAIECTKRKFQDSDLDLADILFVTTDDNDTNRYIYSLAREKGILVNTADVPEMCDFILPANVQRGDLAISISTNGKCPMLARKLRGKFEAIITEEYGKLTYLLGVLRSSGMSRKKSLSKPLHNLLNDYTEGLEHKLKLIFEKDYPALENEMLRVFGFKIDVKKAFDEFEEHKDE